MSAAYIEGTVEEVATLRRDTTAGRGGVVEGDNSAPDKAPTLRDVLDGLGPALLNLVAAPGGLDVAVGRPVIHDPVEPPAIESGDIVLAVGTPAHSQGAEALVEAAGSADAAMVIFKLAGDSLPTLAKAAQAAGVAVLGMTPHLAWGQAHTLLQTATVTSAAGSGSPGDVEAPGAVGDLFSLANAIATMVGGPTTIEDRDSTVLAYSSLDEPIDEHRRQTILGRRVSEEWRNRLQEDGVFRRLWSEAGPIHIAYPDADPPLQPRMAIAVRAGGENLGSIWVAEGSRVLVPDAEDALREAARIAALHLIRARSSEDLDRARRTEMLRSVLEGTSGPELLADAFDVNVDAFVTVLAFRLGASEPEDQAIRTQRATDLVALYCESFRRKAACIAVGPVVYALMPETAPPDRSRLVALASDIIDRLRGPLGTEVTAGIGSTLQGLENVPAARRQADQVLGVVSSPGIVATIDDVRSRTILATLRDVARQSPELHTGKLSVLEEHDSERRTSYVATLRAYLDAFGDIPGAAADISVHQNTFRYRLRRLVEIADLDLHDPVERLVIHLQLHLGAGDNTTGDSSVLPTRTR